MLWRNHLSDCITIHEHIDEFPRSQQPMRLLPRFFSRNQTSHSFPRQAETPPIGNSVNSDSGVPETERTTTSPSLLAAARLQDQQAWQRLVRIYAPLIDNWCRRSSIPPTDVPDFVQEVLAGIWKGLGEFRKSQPGDSFRAWLKGITRNKISDYFRARNLHGVALGGSSAQLRFQEVPEVLLDPDGETTSIEERFVLFRVLGLIRAEFESKTWDAFWMMVVGGKSAVEVAGALSVSAGSVRQSKYKVLRRLRSEMFDLIPESSELIQDV